MVSQLLLALLLALVACSTTTVLSTVAAPAPAPPCVCKEQQFCKPLATPPPSREVFPFVVGSTTSDWYTFRWDLITTASWGIGGNETICHAHKHGARVVTDFALGLCAGTRDPSLLVTSSKQSAVACDLWV